MKTNIQSPYIMDKKSNPNINIEKSIKNNFIKEVK
jgi:hypothetical protein